MIRREIGESNWFGFSLVIRPGSKIPRWALIENLKQLGFECRPINAGNFVKNEAVRYLNYKSYGMLNNVEHVDRKGLFIGNHPYSM